MSAEQKMSAALTSLILEQPFIWRAGSQPAVEVETRTCKTAWTDGRNIGYIIPSSSTHSVTIESPG